MPGLQQRFDYAPDEKSVEQKIVGLVEKHICMKLAVGRQNMIEAQRQGGLGLLGISKGRAGPCQFRQATSEKSVDLAVKRSCVWRTLSSLMFKEAV